MLEFLLYAALSAALESNEARTPPASRAFGDYSVAVSPGANWTGNEFDAVQACDEFAHQAMDKPNSPAIRVARSREVLFIAVRTCLLSKGLDLDMRMQKLPSKR